MSAAAPIGTEKRIRNYLRQTGRKTLTVAQARQVRKTIVRKEHDQ